ncbi:hypothetical protein MNBD_GAMMA22-1113 [hydrothermal vent metagenome]|uniref:histidine kinase n=1 Tax=hydrothermal vent metagenome TaxID=652676 RepID=A0A3B1B160_9ZZZZ
MLVVIVVTFLFIFFIQEFYLSDLEKNNIEVQLRFEKEMESVSLMLSTLKDTRFELSNNRTKNRNFNSPVSINLTNIELIKRIKTMLQYQAKLIKNNGGVMFSDRKALFLKVLLADINVTKAELNKIQKKEITVVSYMAVVRPLLNVLIQYRHVSKDEHKYFLTNVDELKNKKFYIVLTLIIVAVTLAFFIIFKLLKILLELIRENVRVDKELKQHRDELEKKVQSRTSELNDSLKSLELKNVEADKAKTSLIKAKHDAEHANQQKSFFLSRMSHELRTPMNAILGFAQLLEMDISNVELADYVKEILTAGKHLEDLIDEVLDLSKIESGNIDINLTGISLLDIVQESIALVVNYADEKNIRIINNTITEQDCTVLADSLRLKEVILNILTNAIKYNVADGKVTINLKVEHEIVTLSIIDNGIGIANVDQNDVFEPFNRMGAEFTATEGTGIGLSITKTLVELMNGSIGFNSVVEQGTEFWFTLKKISSGHENEKKELNKLKELNERTVAVSNKQHTIIYIEDNNANLRLVEGIINKQHNINLLSHDNAEEGILLIRHKMPDLIILDINLPGMSGFDALSILKQDDDLKHIPVYALSASATAQDIENGLVAGFKQYLIKPIQVKNFISMITAELNNDAVNGAVYD